MDYNKFLKTKLISYSQSGFDIPESELNPMLFDFQKHCVKIALKSGKYALFEDCGLGKTFQQIEWAYQITKKENKPVLIICPLAVSLQTINEGIKLNYDIKKILSGEKSKDNIYIINYEQIDNINANDFIGVVLDESSILKNYTGVYKNKLIELFKQTKYKLCCTATPSPNDINEIGNHSEFLSIMDAQDMRARWFVRDEGMNNYRIKRHAKKEFYGWIASWSMVITKPSDIGYSDKGFILPKLNYIEKNIEITCKTEGRLFETNSVSATNFNESLRKSMTERLNEVVNIIDTLKNKNVIIWIKQNAEADYLKKLLPDSVEVRGNEKTEVKEKKLLDFANNKYRILITKSKIAQFGLNFQNCSNQIFASLDFSFESLYQSIRRSYRFGQKNEVNIFIIKTNTMTNIIESIKEKQRLYDELFREVSKSVNNKSYKLKLDYERKETDKSDYKLINGDSVIEIQTIPDNSIDCIIFSPPFSNLFTYSDSIRDMGNSEDNEQFFIQYSFLLKELYRVLKPGRLMCVHTKDMPVYKTSSGWTGLYDFTGANHRTIESYKFKYHSKITIWTDPVLEMQRTKTQRLLYKQVTSDSTYSGVGLPEYVTIFRKWEGNEENYIPVNFLDKSKLSLDNWQKIASPVWFDIQRTDVLTNYRDGKMPLDEKHICPLQLTVIRRLISLYSNENETVLSPFAGIGSEGYESILNNRKFIGIELKESYYKEAIKNLERALREKEMHEFSLFAV